MKLSCRVVAHAPVARRRMAVKANASMKPDEATRRTVLLGVVSLPVLSGVGRAQAIEIFDDRKTKAFLDSIDQARDSDEDQRNRFSFQNTKPLTLDDHKRRVQESLKRLTTDFKPSIDRSAWPRVEADLRHQLYTLRYDLDALTASKPDKAVRKQAQDLQDNVMRSLENLDFATRMRNKEESLRSLQAAQDNLSNLVKMLG